MKRGTFLKAFIVAVISPKILAAASMNTDVVPPVDKLIPTAEPDPLNESLRLYTLKGDIYRVGDMILLSRPLSWKITS